MPFLHLSVEWLQGANPAGRSSSTGAIALIPNATLVGKNKVTENLNNIAMYESTLSVDTCTLLNTYTLFANFHDPTKTPELRENFVDGYRIYVTELFNGYLRQLGRNAWQGNQ